MFTYMSDMYPSLGRLEKVLPLLPVLAAFAQAGRVTDAALAVQLPQPTVTRMLRQAEQAVGIQLRQKVGRETRPNAAALELGALAAQHLNQWQEQVAQLRGTQEQELHGQVRLAFQHSLGEQVVPEYVRDFVSQHPRVRFELTQGGRSQTLALLNAGRADVALVAEGPDVSAMQSIPIGVERLMLAVPLDHQFAGRSMISVREVAQEPVVTVLHGYGLRSSVDHLYAQYGLSPQVAFEGQELHTILGFVAAGLGVSVVPERNYAAAVTLVALTDPGAKRQLVLATSRTRSLSPAVAAFVAMVQGML